jgi:hypothetical protein
VRKALQAEACSHFRGGYASRYVERCRASDPRDDRSRVGASLAKLGETDVVASLGQSASAAVDHERQMEVCRFGQAERASKMPLARRARQQVFPSVDLGHALSRVIYDDGKLIGRSVITSGHDEVTDFFSYIEGDASAESVFDVDLTGRHSKTERGGASGHLFCLGERRVASEAGTWVTHLLRSLLRGAQGRANVGAAADTRVGETSADELINSGPKSFDSARLQGPGPVPAAAEPLEVAQRSVHPLGAATRSVEVLHAQEQHAVPGAHVPPGEQERARVAKMKQPSGAGC